MRKITRIIILSLVALLMVYNIVAVSIGGGAATISRNVAEWMREYPMLLVAIGVLIGHWCWPIVVREEAK